MAKIWMKLFLFFVSKNIFSNVFVVCFVCCVVFLFFQRLEIFIHIPEMYAKFLHRYACAYQENGVYMGVCLFVCVCFCFVFFCFLLLCFCLLVLMSAF